MIMGLTAGNLFMSLIPMKEEIINISEKRISQIINIFVRQLDFSSQPGVGNEVLENEPKSCWQMHVLEKISCF